jgi:hypothetical protein
MNDTKNPAAVAIEFSSRPCSKASGMRVAAYLRVSTSRQVRLETIELQLEKVVGQ